MFFCEIFEYIYAIWPELPFYLHYITFAPWGALDTCWGLILPSAGQKHLGVQIGVYI